MRKILFIFALITCSFLQAQFTIQGTIDPDHDYSWILLYQMQNGDQTYVANADVIDGQFTFEIDEDQPAGIYRAYYKIENSLYVEFIYNKEDVEFSFDPNSPLASISFSRSEENIVYHDYYNSIKQQQHKIDSVQVLYFKATEKGEEAGLKKEYNTFLAQLKEQQALYEKNSSTLMANHFIRASAQYNSDQPHKDPKDYLGAIKAHFFDAMSLSDSVLSHSTFINDRLHDYVFYLNQGDDHLSQNELQKDAIEKAVTWIGTSTEVLSNFEEELLETYLLQENVDMINFVLDNYYMSLPAAYQNEELLRRLTASLKTAIGVTAPDFSWKQNGTDFSLHSLTGTDYYIVLFFSSNCPHCQMEIPEFYTFISGIENIKVVAVGLEDEKESWEAMTNEYAEFINILDLDKWSSQKVKDYGITAIPTYLVLDVDKKILAKPEDFEELKSMFETK
ncbi:thioredoxin-like domain-containing protein [Lutimonas sp.]|uniref:thioredoxin-like domain-containing protein n=1 Tax=Lutimonas sp. TaxID=1872403 RepID=UPI003C76EA9B